ncbi:MAG: outer membrane protein transport protein, partial [Candidatus Omnitrophota bacterium]
ENIFFHDVTLHTEGTQVIPGVNYTNAGLRQTSNINYLPGGNAGISYRIPGMDIYPVSVGVGAFTIGGVADNYPSSRLNTALLANGGDYDKMVDLRTMRIAPGIAAALNDKLSFGITANIDIQALRANLAHTITPAGLTLFDETEGKGNWDFTVGGGFTVGLLYKMSDMLSLGASYESHNWQGHHYQYKDCLPYIDEPPIVNMGISLKPVKNLEITYDTRYINWTDVKLARNSPDSGGFGWRDQWVFAAGSEYTAFEDKLKLRLGYMYGKSPIQPNVIFANSLLSLIIEHHLTAGFSVFLTKDLSLDFAWEHHFKNEMAEDGGDSVDSIGTGTKVTAAADVISIGLGYKF